MQSLRPSGSGLTLNVDIAAKAFLQPRPCLEHLLKAGGIPSAASSISAQAREAASDAFRGIKVQRMSSDHQRCIFFEA